MEPDPKCSAPPEVIGRIEGLCDGAKLSIGHAWRLIAEGATPGRGDFAMQLRRAEAEIDRADKALVEAAGLCEAHCRVVDEHYERVRMWQAQLLAVDDCWERHMGREVDPIVCVCDGAEIASYCSADHSGGRRSASEAALSDEDRRLIRIALEYRAGSLDIEARHYCEPENKEMARRDAAALRAVAARLAGEGGKNV